MFACGDLEQSSVSGFKSEGGVYSPQLQLRSKLDPRPAVSTRMFMLFSLLATRWPLHSNPFQQKGPTRTARAQAKPLGSEDPLRPAEACSIHWGTYVYTYIYIQ